ncbi:hypothetical protein [Melghirimyces algeriensis]|uniref:Uncharacterized protein n=1 Tax=Melghirimyces algeriensis TaxID=910412 RepID=A0A521F9E9_9BACL|nr:hypothetical protein [Melghirimyces algeriensis]SMO92783.1 hypothetical protein SAMN06264849_1154 [Melghirimyces algeriensis]
MIETYILIPQADNDGNPFSVSKLKNLRNIIIEEFGGVSVEEGTISGYWKGGEKTYKDTNDKYMIALNSLTEIPKFLEIARWVRKEFQQEAVYVNIAGIAEIIGDEE